MCSSESRATVIIAKTNEAYKVRYATYVKTVMLYAGVTQIFFWHQISWTRYILQFS